MHSSSIQNPQVLQFKAAAKNFSDSGFQPHGYVLMGHDGCLDLAVFHSRDLPANLARALDVALPLSIHARASGVVRFFQRDDVRLLFARLHAGHAIAWNGTHHVGVFSTVAQDALEGLKKLLVAFNEEAEKTPA